MKLWVLQVQPVMIAPTNVATAATPLRIPDAPPTPFRLPRAIESSFDRHPLDHRDGARASQSVYEKAGMISLAKSSAMSGMMKLRKK